MSDESGRKVNHLTMSKTVRRYRAGQTSDPRFAPLAGQASWLIGEAWRRIGLQAGPGGGGELE